MTHLRELYDRLPEPARDEVMDLLREALLHQGGGFLGEVIQLNRLKEIAAVFAREGCELARHS